MKVGIKITRVKYIGGYSLEIHFSDGKVNTFDYTSLVMQEHDEFSIYRDKNKFKKFSVINENTDIAWTDDWHMILPLHILYSKNSIGKAGRKPIEDKKRTIRISIRESQIQENGGLESVINMFLKTLK